MEVFADQIGHRQVAKRQVSSGRGFGACAVRRKGGALLLPQAVIVGVNIFPLKDVGWNSQIHGAQEAAAVERQTGGRIADEDVQTATVVEEVTRRFSAPLEPHPI